jgi:hypothetical protein
MYDAFISYARADQQVVASLTGQLEKRGLRFFMDRKVLRPGEEWAPQLGKALQDSRMMVLCWSAHAAASQWVDSEINHCLITKRPVLPWLLDNTPLAPKLNLTHGIVGGDPAPVVAEIARARRSWITRRFAVYVALGVPSALTAEIGRRSFSASRVSFRGHVMDEAGNPVSGAFIDAGGVRGQTAADGGFHLSLPAKPGAALRVIVQKAGFVRREISTQTDVPDLGVILQRQ